MKPQILSICLNDWKPDLEGERAPEGNPYFLPTCPAFRGAPPREDGTPRSGCLFAGEYNGLINAYPCNYAEAEEAQRQRKAEGKEPKP